MLDSASTAATYTQRSCQHFIAGVTGYYRWVPCPEWRHTFLSTRFSSLHVGKLIKEIFGIFFIRVPFLLLFSVLCVIYNGYLCVTDSHFCWQNPDIVLVHYLNVPYPDDNKMAVITPSLTLWGDKKEWTKEELVSQLKPMCKFLVIYRRDCTYRNALLFV